MKGSSKHVKVAGATVVKTRRSGAKHDTLTSQARKLRRLTELGFLAAEVYSCNRHVAVHEYIDGPSLAECIPLSMLQLEALTELADRQVALGIYIGDLNPRNLLWWHNRWAIIDCGAIREGRSPDYIRAKLAHKWRKVGIKL